MIAAGAVATKNVPAFAVAGGASCCILKWRCASVEVVAQSQAASIDVIDTKQLNYNQLVHNMIFTSSIVATLLHMFKKLIKKASPQFYKVLKSVNRERNFRLLNGGSDLRAKQAIIARHGKKVITGPFQGMIYGDKSAGSSYVAKLVGSYEEELHPTIEAIVAKQPSIIIDVGCAEGYYAVGLAKRLPMAQVYAFDIDPDAREYCMELAKLNSLQSQLHIRGLCNMEILEKMLKEMAAQPAFIFCDCEGYEAELFDPTLVPSLKRCDFLIEFHDFIVPGSSKMLQQRFADSHSVQIIDTRPRDVSHYSCLADVPAADREMALSENRPGPMQWGYFQALNR